MPLDPQAKAFLDMMREVEMPALEDLSLEQIRTLPTPIAGEVEAVAKTENRTVPGIDGNEIPVRIYWPEGWSESSEPAPALVVFHGGGWVMGTLDLYDSLARSLSNAGSCVVVSVDYRMAPEHRFPAAAEDSHSAAVYVAENAESLGVDPARIFVGGDSAGGNLAVVVSLMARDRGSVKLAGQVLVYPIADCDFETASYVENAEGYFLTRASMKWFWDQYAPDPADRKHPYASPLKAESLAGLPPAWVMTAGFDPLRDEGEALATRLAADGVKTHLEKFDGQIHGFLRRTDLYDEAWRAIRLIGEFVSQTPSTDVAGSV
ncbi:MAG: alpha/beta hydrolase [Planctomycetota bacterium]|nr:alpha/beta hydrolase [Planctomycetota bacterium]MDA1248888.1 alpha/beta hydrolase [Planctomycetota bacterium]